MATPELELNEDESKKYAQTLARVSNLYDDKFNPKVVAWLDLVCVTGAIYGPRIIAIKARWDEEEKQKPINVNAVPINTPRPSKTQASQPQPQQTPAKTPMDLFGDVNYGAGIANPF
jgi:hypothetical protein